MTERKKITFVLGYLYPSIWGGAEIFNYHFINEIKKYFQIELIAISDSKFDDVRTNQIKIIRPTRFFYPIQLIYLLIKTSTKSSIIYTNYMDGSWLLYLPITLFSLIFKIPYSFTIHSGVLPKWNFKFPYILFFKKAKRIAGVSLGICQEYERRTGAAIKFIPPLIPFNKSKSSNNSLRSKYNLPNNKRIILFVGSLKPLKNPDHILRALNILGNRKIVDNNLCVVFAGDGILKNPLNRLIDEFDLTNSVYLLGNIPAESIHELFSIADFYVISSDHEGNSISLLEAMYNSIPIIASNVPGINNLLTHDLNAFLYDLKNPETLAHGLLKCLQSPEYSKAIGSSANRLYHESYNYENMVLEYLKFLE